MKRPSPLSVLAVLWVLGQAPLHAAPAPRTICDGTTALTLIGIDTTSGAMLFAVPPAAEGRPSWIVELTGDGGTARAFRDDPKGRFGGSVGPGPVLAASPCGDGCLQPVRWKGGVWEPVGETLAVPRASTITPTYDQTGAPWFLVHGSAGEDGQTRAWSFRLVGREWKERGAMVVTAVGQPPALPAPQRKDGVISGTGLFSASGRPEAWLAGVPAIPAARRGQAIALTGTSAAYVSGDGVVYLSDDSGKAWRRSTWTPWGSAGTTGMWRQGSDYWVDLPFGDHRGALRLVWFDRRRPSEEVILLTRLTPSGDWVRVSEVPGDVSTKSGERLPVTQVLVPQGDVWILLSGCAATAQGSGLVLRVFDKALSPARFVPLEIATR
jgi:hypothetical protein